MISAKSQKEKLSLCVISVKRKGTTDIINSKMQDDRNILELAHWADEVDYAVTIADKNRKIIYMNRRQESPLSQNLLQRWRGAFSRNLMDCHPEHARAIIRSCLKRGLQRIP